MSTWVIPRRLMAAKAAIGRPLAGAILQNTLLGVIDHSPCLSCVHELLKRHRKPALSKAGQNTSEHQPRQQQARGHGGSGGHEARDHERGIEHLLADLGGP